MIPDAASIARRRHIVTMIVRSIIALFGARVLWATATHFGEVLQPIYIGGTEYLVGAIWNFLSFNLPALFLVVALFFLESHLVRWIVPIPAKHPGCPKCGYSLKDLNSPICPECGTSLRG